jgi:hypothetical protein
MGEPIVSRRAGRSKGFGRVVLALYGVSRCARGSEDSDETYYEDLRVSTPRMRLKRSFQCKNT